MRLPDCRFCSQPFCKVSPENFFGSFSKKGEVTDSIQSHISRPEVFVMKVKVSIITEQIFNSLARGEGVVAEAVDERALTEGTEHFQFGRIFSEHVMPGLSPP